MQLQSVETNFKPQRYRAKLKHNKSYSIASQRDIADTIKQLNKTGVSITAYQAFIELAGEILPSNNQITLTNNHDELGSSLQVTIELANTSVADCLQWHEKLLEQWVACNEFDVNILFDVMPSKEVVQ